MRVVLLAVVGAGVGAGVGVMWGSEGLTGMAIGEVWALYCAWAVSR